MKLRFGIGISLLFMAGVLGMAAPALAVPQYLNYQGVLRDNSGSLVSGTKAMTFGLFDVASGGTALWSMVSSEVAVSNGLYNVQLGPLTHTELGSGRRWLEAMIGAEILSPRLEILSAAYAVTAGTADNTNYAVLSGTASNAATAATAGAVNGPVSAEAASGFALFANGKIGAAGASLGSDSIPAGNTSTTIINGTLLSATSLVFISGGVLAGFDPTSLFVYRKGADRFTVTIAPAAPVGGYPFNYLIIN